MAAGTPATDRILFVKKKAADEAAFFVFASGFRLVIHFVKDKSRAINSGRNNAPEEETR
jgi:hypothetical protein